MSIKKVKPIDIDDVYKIFVNAHKASCYGFLKHDEALVKKQISDVLLTGFAYIDIEAGAVLLAEIQPFWFNLDKTIANDMVFYAPEGKTKAAIALLKKYIQWGELNADYVGLSVSIGGNIMVKVENFYKRFNFKRVGGDFVRGFEHV